MWANKKSFLVVAALVGFVVANKSFGVVLNKKYLDDFIAKQFPGKKKDEIEELYFSRKGITKIEPGVFEGFKNLETLALLNNSITNLDKDIFQSLNNLRALWLNDKTLEKLLSKILS